MLTKRLPLATLFAFNLTCIPLVPHIPASAIVENGQLSWIFGPDGL